MTSVALTDILCASSATVIVSGTDTSRTTGPASPAGGIAAFVVAMASTDLRTAPTRRGAGPAGIAAQLERAPACGFFLEHLTRRLLRRTLALLARLGGRPMQRALGLGLRVGRRGFGVDRRFRFGGLGRSRRARPLPRRPLPRLLRPRVPSSSCARSRVAAFPFARPFAASPAPAPCAILPRGRRFPSADRTDAGAAGVTGGATAGIATACAEPAQPRPPRPRAPRRARAASSSRRTSTRFLRTSTWIVRALPVESAALISVVCLRVSVMRFFGSAAAPCCLRR